METTKQLVNVRVIKQLPLGLSIETENGQRGIVRIREISWDTDIRNNWKKMFPTGWIGTAVPIEARTNQFQEFSLRLTEHDPWDYLISEKMLGATHEGVVTGVVPYGAFIELEAGLTGLLHQSGLPRWANKDPLDLFWPGDKVRVVIESIDHERRRIGLELSSLVKPPATQAKEHSQTSKKKYGNGNGIVEPDRFLHLSKMKQYILVVEDDSEQASMVATWLRRVGQRVDIVNSAEAALELLEKSQPDLTLVDVILPGMNGIELSGIILERWPGVRVVCATDWARADEMTDALDSLQARGAELLIKPLQPDDLIGIIKKENTETPPDIGEKVETTKNSSALPDSPGFRLDDSIRTLLQQCRKHLGFEQAVLFTLDPAHRTASIVESSAELNLDKKAVSSLIYSPVRDVAEDKEIILMNEIQATDHKRFRYLLDLFPTITSCIGVPVPVQMPFDYALFAIDRHSRKIGPEQQMYAEAIALAIGAQLEQDNFQEQAKLIQRTALIGQLTRAMVHEINNLIGPLSARLENLSTSLNFLEKKKEGPDLHAARTQLIQSELVEIQKNVKKIVNTTRMFGRITAKSRNEILRIDEIIDETITLLRDTSDRLHVTMMFTPPKSLVVLRTQAAALEQVLLNVMLNAIQQIAELGGEMSGWVEVRLDAEQGKNKSDFRILIEDNGPGIHASLWETIFEPGYTTRQDGSGIGLYVSRNLVEEIGGRLFVAESYILGGTTFTLELPRHIL
jgi:signal transduction histidine kinase/predicted RNA-binding protein with RPS1 domain